MNADSSHAGKPADLRALVTGAIERAALDEDVRVLAAAVSSQIVEWRWLPSSGDLHDPEPFLAERCGGDVGAAWPSERAVHGRRIGLDAAGRPVLEEDEYFGDPGRPADLGPKAVWTHGPRFAEERLPRGVRRIAFDADGRVAAVVEVRSDRVTLARWTWFEDGGVRIDQGHIRHGRWCSAMARRVRLAPDGSVRDLLGAHADGDPEAGGDHVGALLGAVERAGRLTLDRVFYSERVSGAIPPLRADLDGLVGELADALDRAIRAALARAAVPEPYVVSVGAGEDVSRRSALPWVEVGSRPLCDALTAAWERSDVAVDYLSQGFEAGLAARVELPDLLDDDAMRAWRELRAAAADGGADADRGRAALLALEAELAQRLNAEPPAGATEPFLALVGFDLIHGERHRDRRWRTAEAAVGGERAAVFRRMVCGRGAPLHARGGSSAGAPGAVGDPLTDRTALAALLIARGVPAADAERLAGEASVVLDLVSPPAGVASARSRLGGPPLLPAGIPWPQGRTFLAGLDLSELRAGGLPHSGWVLVYSAADPADVTAGVIVLDVAPGSTPVAADGPALVARPIVPRPWLELPGEPAGLAATSLPGLRAARDELMRLWIDRLNAPSAPAEQPHGRRRRRRGEAAHVALGGAACIGGRTADGVVLLRLESDAAMGFETFGARALELRVSMPAAATRDWSAVQAADVHNI